VYIRLETLNFHTCDSMRLNDERKLGISLTLKAQVELEAVPFLRCYAE